MSQEHRLTKEEILSRVDHTLLAQTATWDEIKALCDDAVAYGTASVCIPPNFVKMAKSYVGEQMKICTVIGFPNGYSASEVKIFETQQALDDGADETCFLTEEEKIQLCHVVTDSGADYIKTSTGFGGGGATFEDVKLFAEHIGPGVKIKAAGGIASMEDAERFIELGASRLGTSRIVKLVKGEM